MASVSAFCHFVLKAIKDKRLLLGRGGLGALPSVLGFGFVFGVLGVCLSVHSRISAPH